MHTAVFKRTKELLALLALIGFLICFAFAAVEVLDLNEMLDDVFGRLFEMQYNSEYFELLAICGTLFLVFGIANRVILASIGIDSRIRPFVAAGYSGGASIQSLTQQYNN